MARAESRFLLLTSPYRSLGPMNVGDPFPARRQDRRGSALVWRLSTPAESEALDFARARPPGTALIVILPPADRIGRPEHLLRVTELCRPHSILPHHHQPNLRDLRSVLTRPPEDLPGEVTDYLAWRGVDIDMDTRRLVRKTVELSAELNTVNGLARSLYLSRRALGRRFTTRGLPVPSHWLHFGRVLRAALRLQDTQETLFAAATAFGYPDGFALSNQMVRLVGIRPTIARDRLGWEWLLEEWLLQEARSGGFSREVAAALLSEDAPTAPPRHTAPADPPSTREAPRRIDVRPRSREGNGDPEDPDAPN